MTAEYSVLPNGTAYHAAFDAADASGYSFTETGILGERVPVKVANVTLSGACSECNYTWKSDSEITFPRGNYTISYDGPIRENHIQGTFNKPYDVMVFLPPEFSVSNPLLAGLSHGAVVTKLEDNRTRIQWNTTLSFDLRFYDANREALLYLFGNFWLVIAIVLLLPFLLTMRRKP
jgi:hypothetical protein